VYIINHFAATLVLLWFAHNRLTLNCCVGQSLHTCSQMSYNYVSYNDVYHIFQPVETLLSGKCLICMYKVLLYCVCISVSSVVASPS
jgi:hypothetical protein